MRWHDDSENDWFYEYGVAKFTQNDDWQATLHKLITWMQEDESFLCVCDPDPDPEYDDDPLNSWGFFEDAPEKLRIYRGADADFWQGASWTTDPLVAEWFCACHFPHRKSDDPDNRVMITAEISKYDVLVWIDGEEKEVIIPPELVTNPALLLTKQEILLDKEQISQHEWLERYS